MDKECPDGYECKAGICVKEGTVVLRETGKEIGTHDGAELFTLGERHGFHITDPTIHEALYVVGKDLKKNILTVSSELNISVTKTKEIEINNTNWIGEIPKKDKKYKVRIRYRGDLLQALIFVEHGGRARVAFEKNTPLVSSGQSIVLYEEGSCGGFDGLRCVGGGIVV